MGNGWATRGRKPDRIVEAAFIAGGFRFLKAIIDGDARPWVPALAPAVGAGAAMDKHRIADRERANERNSELADKAAGIVSSLLDAADSGSQAAVAGPGPATPTYRLISSEWERFVVSTGKNPDMVELTQDDWSALSLTEQSAIHHACESCGARLRVGGQDLSTANPVLAR